MRQLRFRAIAMASQVFVYRIVDHLPNQVMESLDIGTTDIHTGSLADGIQSLQDLDIRGCVGVFVAHVRIPWSITLLYQFLDLAMFHVEPFLP